MFRAKARAGEITTTDLRRMGHAIVHCCGPRVLPELHRLGWYITQESKTTDIDCKGWFHCGSGCCGRCPYCGDKRRGERKQTLVSPPTAMSRTAAKSLLNHIMTEVIKQSKAVV